ncbi:ligand-effect modulator 3 family [Polychytrium aggregatum]|uniref:ligand-effect modulator 3 family n=1 Tax=Polychytrium aggregatum TaxID=110093 RepID=UPI0022FEE23E|nr:ligand-effect modulator 3 family [Polychytrium aggregatum]KAI9199816.1 ligand-effect modulator 3 family [Polychytrium aggregatum]
MKARRRQVAGETHPVGTPTSHGGTAAPLSEHQKRAQESRHRFKQQNVKSWTLILSPSLVLPALYVIAVIFIPIGCVLYYSGQSINEVSFDYTMCKMLAPSQSFGPPPSDSTKYGFVQGWKYSISSSVCTLRFNIPAMISAPAYLYIQLTNFKQNHRIYVKSLSDAQLRGDLVPTAAALGDLSSTCGWLQYANCHTYKSISDSLSFYVGTNNLDCPVINGVMTPVDNVIANASSSAQYYPCGLMANSMFTDDISVFGCVSLLNNVSCTSGPIEFQEEGISWGLDSSIFGNTQWNLSSNGMLSQIPTMLIPPPMWRRKWPQKWGNGYNSTNLPSLATWERFQVWMRPAGLSTFRKLWGIYNGNINAGIYEVNITDSFEVMRFSGTKSIVISTVGIMGSRNQTAAIAYLAVGSVSGVAALIFTILHLTVPRKPGDHRYLSWVRVQEANRKRKFDVNIAKKL